MPDIDYRHLIDCQIEITNSLGARKQTNAQSMVKLPQECYQAANLSLPDVYDFALEKSILDNKGRKEPSVPVPSQSWINGSLSSTASSSISSTTSSSGTRNNISGENSILQRMQSVTNADERVCISILENHNYDLKTSVEAYFTNQMGNFE